MPRQPDSIFLHIGHGKTGSSFLQSALALSTETLAKHGLAYPIDEKRAAVARQGHTTGGNIRGESGAFNALVKSTSFESSQKLVISSESLFFHMQRDGADFITELHNTCPGVPVHVLCYVRDPVDHAVSQYHQRVKRSGFTGTLADSFSVYNTPERAGAVLSRFRDAGATLTVLNYSRHRDGLINTLEHWLGLPADTLTLPQSGSVNRSLTRAELELHRIFNRFFGTQARHYVSDPLIHGLPDIRSENPPLAREELSAFLKSMAEMISAEAFCGVVPESERPRVGTVEDHIARFPAPEDDPDLKFTPAQLTLFAEAVARQMKKAGIEGSENKMKVKKGRRSKRKLT